MEGVGVGFEKNTQHLWILVIHSIHGVPVCIAGHGGAVGSRLGDNVGHVLHYRHTATRSRVLSIVM